MPGSGPKYYNCVVCSKRTKPKERKTIDKSVKKYLLKSLFISANERDIICNRCKHTYYVKETTQRSVPIKASSSNNDALRQSQTRTNSCPVSSPPSVTIKIPSTSTSHSRCLICKKPGPKLLNISSNARFNIFIEHNVLIPAGTRCCPVHLDEGLIKANCMENVPTTESSFINRTSILNIVKQMRELCLRKQDKLDFDNIREEECNNLTGLNRTQFDDLCMHVKDKVKNTSTRSMRTTVGLFLLKLKSGMSNKLLSTIFRVSKSSIRRAIVTVRHALMRSFVPLYLGLESITRQQIIQDHTRPLAKSLFGTGADEMILVLDGTYIYIQKSNNFSFQRRSYSVHKGRPLVKPMVVVSTTGYFVTVVGPYFADGKNNDAAILNHMLRSNVQDFKNFVQENDIMVVDRGFRDSISLLEELGIRAEMPAFMSKGVKQMPVEDANASRLVTKIRWVVESANARIKRWKYLDHVLPTNQVPFIGDYVRIVSSIANKYFPPLSAAVSTQDDVQLAAEMRQRSEQVNELKSFVEENNLERRSVVWQPVGDFELDHFPRLSEDKLRSITCGVYQLKLSSSYIQEHIDGDSDIHVYKDDVNIIRVRIQSRHTSAKKYLIWLKFNQCDVTAWYCKCRAGARVVGVCAHVTTIMWYLGYARHLESSTYGVRNWGLHLADASHIPEPIDSSDTDSDANSVIEE